MLQLKGSCQMSDHEVVAWRSCCRSSLSLGSLTVLYNFLSSGKIFEAELSASGRSYYKSAFLDSRGECCDVAVGDIVRVIDQTVKGLLKHCLGPI